MNGAVTLIDRSIEELMEWVLSWELRRRMVGVATINALSQIVFQAHPGRYNLFEGNLIKILRIRPEDVVALIGLIKPFIPILRSESERLYVLERAVPGVEGVLPDTACEEIVPEADIVVITGSSLANGTIDRLLALSEGARRKALVGPTASCLPDTLFDRGLDYLAGILVIDFDRPLRVAIEGGGTPQLKEACRFVTYISK